MTRSKAIAIFLCIALCLGMGIWLARRGGVGNVAARFPQPQSSKQSGPQTNASAPTATNGIFIDKDKQIFVNYGTKDPALQSFVQALMDGSYDTTAKGRAVFLKICGACHQPDGMGKDGLAPPLVGSEWVLAADGNRLVRIVLNGMTGPVQVKGREWNLTMPPWRENLRDDQIAVVLTYIRTKLGSNKATAIQPEIVSKARDEPHPKPETAGELMRLAE
jgi:mono/diheme cytochrome c family protein